MRIPIYVIHWNAAEWCSQTVASLLASEGVDPDVTVIDNASPVTPTLPSSVAVDRLLRNTGFTGGANRALDLFQTRAEPFCCITSHDVQVDRDALRTAIIAATDSPAYGILGLNGEGLSGDEIIDREWISGTFFLMRRDCIESVGQFDPLFYSYVEDIDYCHRAIAAGWKLGIVRDAVATSHGSIARDQAIRMTHANLTLLAAKEGDYRLVSMRLLGMLRRAIAHPRDHWLASFTYSMRQLVRWIASRRRHRGDTSA